MPEFRADLHIHSRFSRATSSSLSFPLLAGWASLKGIQVLGTGDFTHPGWLAELKKDLVFESSSGLFRLRRSEEVQGLFPELADSPLLREQAAAVRFMLQTEVSSIYKRDGRVRKVHNLVYMPSLEAVEHFNRKLGQAGNLEADGRPILGLDARNLLELALETHDQGYLIPAHIWTPWFSIFGSKSGFDRLEDCFGPLSGHIFALETGLSSDLGMNRRLSALDRFKMVSNSDAHSGDKLARDANLFSGELSYNGIFTALKAGRQEGLPTRFLGTYDFFPDEGKYHLDGHRACGVSMIPEDTRSLGGICPVCGKPLTVGVLNRVQALADRDEPLYRPDERFSSFIPLVEIVSEILGAGSASGRCRRFYQELLRDLGPELEILFHTPAEDLSRHSSALAEGILRMRRGEVIRKGGFDGEFGSIRVFSQEEARDLKSGGRAALVLTASPPASGRERAGAHAAQSLFSDMETLPEGSGSVLSTSPDEQGLNDEQRKAVRSGPQPVLALAGPGTGKTHTLVERVLRLVREGVPHWEILVLTFTRRAARELEERLRAAFGEGSGDVGRADRGETVLPRADTLHALALEFWQRSKGTYPLLLDEEAALRVFTQANRLESLRKIREAWHSLNLCRERRSPLPEEFQSCAYHYHERKTAWGQADYTDLLEFWLSRAGAADQAGSYAWGGWTQVLADEIQDLSPLQLELVAALSPEDGKGFFGIGDPNQSIYGFRGAHGQVEDFFLRRWPRVKIIRLRENFRSGRKIIQTVRVLADTLPGVATLEAVSPLPAEVYYFEAQSAEAEADWLAGRIRACLGSTSHSLVDASSRMEPAAGGLSDESYSPGDFAVLLRSRALMLPYARALERHGIPFSQPCVDPFWADERVRLLLQAAGRSLGITPWPDQDSSPESVPECPERVIAHGPEGMGAYWGNREPFGEGFWKSRIFKDLSRAYEQNQGWAGLFNWLSLQNELEEARAKSEKVQLLTLHAAKGLEFRMVFLPALEDGLMPFAGPENDPPPDRKNQEEEFRLFYVGLTRARQGLFLSRAEKRRLYGRECRFSPSPFLKKLPGDIRRSRMVAVRERREEQMNLFGSG
ncbi:MAG: UvrD-helicase domain-containing protein [Desulfovibrionaceae bacterium]|nr:UvrD-helicase domain-containing protein [Desulfovibrionaceae bacterium]